MGHSDKSVDEDTYRRRYEEASETFRIIKEMSDILNTGLDSQSLASCLRLCEEGVDPLALAHLIKQWRQKKNSTSRGRGHPSINGNY